MSAYYNEIDPYAAQWLRNLIAAGHIAPGDVDERSIKDVRPDDLKGYTQCHFFAGVGVWSYALRLAGWPDDRPVWTGSCPCQPFSAAGKQGGFDDERHLWPEFFRLIREREPVQIFGEQVASKDGLAWLDLVFADLEGAGYAVGAADICAAGVGAPHSRQRLWIGAERLEHSALYGRIERRAESSRRGAAGGRRLERVADTKHTERWSVGEYREDGRDGQNGGRQEAHRLVGARGEVRVVGHAQQQGLEGHAGHGDGTRGRQEQAGSATEAGDAGGVADANEVGYDRGGARGAGRNESANGGDADRPGPTNGFWRAADWLGCRDGKWRPVEPGTFPLAHGAAARVGRLRAYGNAIVPQVAAEAIQAFDGR